MHNALPLQSAEQALPATECARLPIQLGFVYEDEREYANGSYAEDLEQLIGDPAYDLLPSEHALLRAYFHDVDQLPRFGSAAAVRAVMSAAHEQPACRGQFLRNVVEGHLGVVIASALRIVQPGDSLLELLQVGNAALVEAARTYDHDSNLEFARYARFTILPAMFAAHENAQYSTMFPEDVASAISNVDRFSGGVLAGGDKVRAHAAEAVAPKVSLSASQVRYLWQLERMFLADPQRAGVFWERVRGGLEARLAAGGAYEPDIDVPDEPEAADETEAAWAEYEADQAADQSYVELPDWETLGGIFVAAKLEPLEVAAIAIAIGQVDKVVDWLPPADLARMTNRGSLQPEELLELALTKVRSYMQS